MSTTHPTNITTEWDDIQRKYGNLPKIEKEKTNEELDAAFVERTEEELLRESRLKEWKKKLTRRKDTRYGTPVNITATNFVDQVTNASKFQSPEEEENEREFADLSSKTGSYVPVLLLDQSKEANLLKEAWKVLASRYPYVKFTVGSALNVLKLESNRASPPSSVLLYFSGSCLFQKNVSSFFKGFGFEISDDTLENRLANSLENLLNGVQGHLPLVKHSDKDSPKSDSESDSESDHLKSAGRDLKKDFLQKLSKGGMGNTGNSKAYTSWILDKAIGD